MEDLKKRLAFENRSIQLQALRKIYKDLLEQKTLKRLDIISASSPEIAELKLVWENTGVSDNVVTHACCEMLVNLVPAGHAEFSYIMNGFLNLIPSSKNVGGIISAISRLLVLQTSLKDFENECYRSPYTLRSPPHPFITVLMHRPDSWIFLQDQVRELFLTDTKRVNQNALQILCPFLKFVLLEPHQSLQYQPMKNALQSTLLHVVMVTDDDVLARDVLDFLAKTIRFYQIQDSSQLTATGMLIVDVLQSVCSRLNSNMTELSALVFFAFELVSECLDHCLPVKGLIDAIAKVEKLAPEILDCDQTLISISFMLLKCSADESVVLINIAISVLKKTETSISEVAMGMLVLPCLQLLGINEGDKHTKRAAKLAGDLLRVVETKTGEMTHNVLNKSSSTKDIANSKVQPFVLACRRLSCNPHGVTHWLKNLKRLLQHKCGTHHSLSCLVASFMTTSNDNDQFMAALDCLTTIARQDHLQAIQFLPLLLYCLRREHKPEAMMAIIKALPDLAHHKYNTPQILKTIHALGSNPALKAVSIDLLTQLWLIQDRIYPHLLKVITEDISPEDEGVDINEVLLAKAKAIKEVCENRGSQHGADMLEPISRILDLGKGPNGGAAVSLALEGLYFLCEAEIIDIQSAWSVLGEQLSKDTRAVVKTTICQLFSLLPELRVKTEEFEAFHDFVLSILWLSAQKESPDVASSALESLSAFNARDFKISHISEHLIGDFIHQAQSAINQDEKATLTLDDVIPYIPGICYTRLLKDISPDVLKSYGKFLSAMVQDEMKNMPRGISYSSLRQRNTANQNKAVSTIPAFILQQYEKNKQPSLRPGLAAGLLFTFDIPLDVGRDGKPRKHSIITRSKNYQQMFSTLLHEVLIQPSDWHRCMVTPQAWTNFIERLFTAMLEGRVAEIELQVKREHIGESDGAEKIAASWMWARDQLVDAVRGASRGSPTMQGNAILSLSGLAYVVNKHVCGLSKEAVEAADKNSEYRSHHHWLTVVIDTLMSLMDVTCKPKGPLLGMCQQRSEEDRLPAGVLAQASAVLSLAQLAPILVTIDTENVFTMMSSLQNRLTGERGMSDSPVVQFHVGLGLGMFLTKLVEEHFLDICGHKGLVQVWSCFDAFERCCLSDTENISGAVLGLGLLMSALCQEGKTETRAHVASILDKLISKQNSLESTDSTFQAMCMCLSMTAGAAFCANIISVEQVNSVVDRLLKVHQENTQLSGASLSFGLLSYMLWRQGHPMISDIRKDIFQSWTDSLSDKETLPLVQASVVGGLMASVGSERILSPTQGDSATSNIDLNIDEVIKLAKFLVSSGCDPGIQNNTAWILGHLYMSLSTVTENRSSVPANYSYLPDQSFVRALVDFLIEAGKLGPDFINSEQVQTVLVALQSCTERPLPPLNWAGILTPIMRLNYSDGVKKLDLKLGVQQSASSPSAAMFLTAWMHPPLHNSLPENCVYYLYENLSLLIKSTAPDTIKNFLSQGQQSEVKDIFHHLLFGLQGALKVNDPPEAMTSILHQTLKDFYRRNSTELEDLHLLAECMGSVSDELFDSLIEEDIYKEEGFLKGLVTRCYLVGQGRQPIAILNSCIDASLHASTSDIPTIEVLLKHMFWQMTQHKSEYSSPMERLKWLTELLGHLGNTLKQKAKVSRVALSVVTSAIMMWTCHTSTPFADINPVLLSRKYATPSFAKEPEISTQLSEQNSLPLFPAFAKELLHEPWCQILPKVYDWMLLLQTTEDDENLETTHIIQDVIRTLRHSTDFRKPMYWTEFFNNMLVP